MLPPATASTGLISSNRPVFVAALRQLEIPLVEVRAILSMDREAAAERIANVWTTAETKHVARRDLVELVKQLKGKRPVMYEVETRDIPSRSFCA